MAHLKHLKIIVPLLMIAAALASCSTTFTCMKLIDNRRHSVNCYGFEDELDDKRSITFDLGDVVTVPSIKAQLGVSVSVGAVNVTYQAGDGGFITMEVSPKKPLIIQNTMRVLFSDQVQITVEASGGVASGVRWSADFTR